MIMRYIKSFLFVIIGIIVIVGCQKEEQFPINNTMENSFPSRILKNGEAVIFDELGTTELIGVLYTEEGNSTFTYEVTSGRKPSLSHWNLNILPCAPGDGVADVILLVSTDETTGYGKDGSLKKYDDELKYLDWLKFDTGYQDNETRIVSFTLEGHWYVGDVLAVAKGGKTIVQAIVEGPVCASCNECNSFIDSRDGQEYSVVQIGDQCWMAENLNYDAGNGSFWYLGNSNYGDIYGRLYNWETAITACPEGWYLPSDEEWMILSNYLIDNGFGYEGSGNDIGKSIASKSEWKNSSDFGDIGNDQQSNNKSLFTAFPGGLWYHGFYNLGIYAYFWSSTEVIWANVQAWSMTLSYNGTRFYRESASRKENGQSVRCLKDE